MDGILEVPVSKGLLAHGGRVALLRDRDRAGHAHGRVALLRDRTRTDRTDARERVPPV